MEFYTPESVLMAMTLTGTKFKGQEIVVQASQAEKNRAAAAAKFKKETQEQLRPSEPSEGAMRISIEGFAELLNNLTQTDLLNLFSPFGSIEYIELPKKEAESKLAEEAIAYIQFKRSKDAKEAIRKMNGIKFKGKTLKVEVANEGLKPSRPGEHIPTSELEAEEKGRTIDSLESRQALMQKLTRNEPMPAYITNPQPTVSAATLAAAGAGNEPSHCLILGNLFDPATVDLRKDPGFFLDIKEEVIGIIRDNSNNEYLDACSEFGKVEYSWVDQSSNGNVWVKFEDKNVQAATKSIDKMNGRFFAGRRVVANYVPETVFNSKVVPS